MGSTFNPHILVDKLSKLNSSQQSIETLSHWCIFHMNKAKQVVETWDRQFHCSPREQRLAFLYLANDILQNSRRKGAEFVAEFWKVLPDALRDVTENGDAIGRNAALRLISIWEERKVFGSRGQILKEEFVKRRSDNDNRNSKHAGSKLRSPGGNAVDKLVSGYQAVYSSQLDEDAIFNKCRNAISFIEKVDKDVDGEYGLGHVSSGITDELKGQHSVLRDCIEQLAVVESCRANLVSLLREALQDQVYKLERVRDQLQTAQTRSEQAGTICQQLLTSSNGNGQILPDQIGNPLPIDQTTQSFTPGEQSSSMAYAQQALSLADKSDDPKSAAAAVAAKLAASTSSAQMLTFVLSSLASEGVIGSNNPIKGPSNEYPSDKRVKIEKTDHTMYVPQASQALLNSHELTPDEKPPPPSSPPPLPPLPPPMQPYPVPQYMQTAMPIPYGYSNASQPLQIPQPGYAPVGSAGVSLFAPPSNSYQGYPSESGFYGQPSSLPMAPMSRQ